MSYERQPLSNLLNLMKTDAKLTKLTNVLYLDDEHQNLNAFKASFRRTYNIFTAQTEGEALEVLRSNDIDVFITDFRMPRINGNYMVKTVKHLYPQIKSMIITAYSEGVQAKVPVLDKPWNVLEIVKNINYICGVA